MELLFYNPAKIKNEIDWTAVESIRAFYGLFSFMNDSVFFHDRTGTITTPFRSKNLFPLPAHAKNVGCSYEEIVLSRAKELLLLSQKKQKPLGVFWSGGIDSTVILVALKMLETNRTALKERVHVILSPESIREYPEFYAQHIRGQFRIEPSHSYSEYFQNQYILVTGEGNDQLFGSQLIASVPGEFGVDFLQNPANEETIGKFLNHAGVPHHTSDLLTALFLRLNEKCPSGIDSVFEFMWWLNLTCKWQTVYMRMLGFLLPAGRSNIDADFISQNYHCFFMTPEFENWSIWHKHLKIKNSLKTYKYEAKEFIFRFNQDKNYLENKVKIGSLYHIINRQASVAAIDDSWEYHDMFPFEEVFVASNSFC